MAEVSADFAKRVAEGVRQGLGTDVAARREGFARFCRETLGLERAVVMKALGLGLADEVGQRTRGVVDAATVKANAEWVGRWLRRFPERRAGR